MTRMFLMVLFLLMVFGSHAYGGNEEVNDLQAVVSVSSLKEEVEDLKTSISSLKEENEHLKTSISSLKEEDVTLKISISSLKEEDEDLKTSISSLKEKDVTLKTSISSLKEEDEDLKTSISSLKEEDEDLKTSISSLKEEDDNMNTSISSLKEEDEDLKTSISSLKEEDVTLNTSISSLKDEVENLKKTVSSLQSNSVKVSAFTVTNPTGDGQPLKFTWVVLNERGNFNAATGKFTCTIPGVYFFALSLTKLRSSSVDRVYAWIRQNGYDKVFTRTDPDEHYADAGSYGASTTVTLRLSKGDIVDVWSSRSNTMRADATVFSGFLIQPDEN